MQYFQGETLGGQVKTAPATTFKDLVDRLLSVPVPLNISRQDYAALPPKEKDRVKQVPFLTAARFKSSPSRRKSEHALACSLIFLDVDPPKDGSTQPAKLILGNLDLLDDQLHPWSYAVYHTASSTPTTPRLRVVVDADVPLDRYEEAVKTVAKSLGLPRVTTESMVPVQAMYLPSLFADEDPEEYQPLIASMVTGKRFTVEDIKESADVQTERRARTPTLSADGSLDPLDFLRNPMDNVSVETIEEMLESVDPDLEYREWLEVAAALRHQFADDPETGYTLFNAWSARGQKYQGEEETQAKWASFRTTPKGRAPVTLRSLMHRASLGGWDSGKTKQTQFEATQKWLQDASSVNVLLTEGLSRIAATPMLTQAEEEGLLNLLAKQSRVKGMNVSVGALRKDLKAMRDKLKDKTEHKPTIPAWVRGCCYVAATEQMFRHSTGEVYSLQSWDNVYAKRLLPTEEQLERMGQDPSMANLSRPMVPPRQFALNVVKVPAVWDYTYDPASPNDIFVIDEGKAYVNTYRRCHPQPKSSEAEQAGKLFVHHIETLIAEPEYQRILIDWLAFNVQAPGVKIRWSPLIQGAEGCGKTFLADTMAVVLGAAHVKPIGGGQLFSGYNEWATGHQLVVLEEVRIAGVNRHEVMNVLKPLITNDKVPINQKFRDGRHVANRTNYILLTNHKDSLALNHESRRYFVLQSAIQTKEQVEALKINGHFAALYDMIGSMGGGIRAFFEEWDISPEFDPNASAPTTCYLGQLIDDSANETVATVRRLIREGDNSLVQPDMLSSKVLLEMLHDAEGMRKITAQHLSSVLRDEGFVQITRTIVGDERHYLWRHTSSPAQRDWVEVARVRHASGVVEGETLEDIL